MNKIHVDFAYISEGQKLYERGNMFASVSYDAETKILVCRDEYFKVYTFYDVVELEICGGN